MSAEHDNGSARGPDVPRLLGHHAEKAPAAQMWARPSRFPYVVSPVTARFSGANHISHISFEVLSDRVSWKLDWRMLANVYSRADADLSMNNARALLIERTVIGLSTYSKFPTESKGSPSNRWIDFCLIFFLDQMKVNRPYHQQYCRTCLRKSGRKGKKQNINKMFAWLWQRPVSGP